MEQGNPIIGMIDPGEDTQEETGSAYRERIKADLGTPFFMTKIKRSMQTMQEN
jgi:hypothetical protein